MDHEEGKESSKASDNVITKLEEKEIARLDGLPRWLYAFYPSAQYSEKSGCDPEKYGVFEVTVVEAMNLMAADLNLVSQNTSDPYVKMSFGVVRRIQCESRVVMRTLNPRWNFSKKFSVIYPESTLKISVWDYDQLDAHDFLGHVEIPLSVFKEQNEIDAWYALKPYDGQRRGRIRVRATFKYSKFGELFAHFLEKELPIEEVPTLNINHLYAYAMDLLEQIEPFKQFPNRVLAVLAWESPAWTIFWLVVFWKLMHSPHNIMPFGHLCLLYYIFTKYMERHFGRATNSNGLQILTHHLDAEAALQSKIDGEASAASKVSSTKDGEAEDDELDRMDKEVDDRDAQEEKLRAEDDPTRTISLGNTGNMVDMILAATPGAKESLAGLQLTCKNGVASIKSVYHLFDWSDFSTTKGVTIGVTGSMLIFTFVPNNLIFLTVGLLAFFNGTPPFQVFKRYALGLVAWLTSAKKVLPAEVGLKCVPITRQRIGFKALAATAGFLAKARAKAKAKAKSKS